jgi:polyphosphate kinase
VEAVVPVEATQLQERLRSVLETCLEDNRQAWDLHADGDWVQRKPHGEVRSTHVRLLADSWGRPPEASRTEAPTLSDGSLRQATGD